MKKTTLFVLFAFTATVFSSCDMTAEEEQLRSEVMTEINNNTLVYELYKTGRENYRYEYKLIGNGDTTRLFSANITDAEGNNPRMDIEQGRGRIVIKVDKDVESQSRTVDGFTYELQAMEP